MRLPFVGWKCTTSPFTACCEIGAWVGRLLASLRLAMEASGAAAAAVSAIVADDFLPESTITIFLLGLVGWICALGVNFLLSLWRTL